jgi:hypothetical protein
MAPMKGAILNGPLAGRTNLATAVEMNSFHPGMLFLIRPQTGPLRKRAVTVRLVAHGAFTSLLLAKNQSKHSP